MSYAYIKNGSLEKLVARPNWQYDDGTQVTDATLAESGYLPIAATPPAFDPATQSRVQLNKEQWIVHADHVEATYQVTDKSLDTVLTERKRALNIMRDEGIFGGAVSWTRPRDSVVIAVDLRGPGDRANIQDLRSAAIVMDGMGETGAVIAFRAADDVVYMLTPIDMLLMSQAVMQVGQTWYAAAWAHKDALTNIAADTTLSDADKIAQIVAYDPSAENGGWPV